MIEPTHLKKDARQIGSFPPIIQGFQSAKIQEYHLIPVQFCWESKLVPYPALPYLPLNKGPYQGSGCHKFLQQKRSIPAASCQRLGKS